MAKGGGGRERAERTVRARGDAGRIEREDNGEGRQERRNCMKVASSGGGESDWNCWCEGGREV